MSQNVKISGPLFKIKLAKKIEEVSKSGVIN